jgi:hypothetical protein
MLKYLPQQPILEDFQDVFLPQCEQQIPTPTPTPIQNSRQITVLCTLFNFTFYGP